MGALFSLTVHDRLLIEAVGKLSEPTPHAIRRVVRETAASGIAGRAVRRSAEAAQADDAASKAQLEVTLIRHLLGAVGVEAVDPELAGASGEALHTGLRARLIEAAARLRSTPDELLEMVGQIAEAAVHVGAPDAETPSRNERRIEQLAHFVDSVRAWDSDPSDGGPAAAVIGGAERQLAEARQSHEAARALLGNGLRLAVRWRAKPEAAAQHLERTDWLLDGWPEICVT